MNKNDRPTSTGRLNEGSQPLRLEDKILIHTSFDDTNPLVVAKNNSL
jgi:hypothetical protein